MTTSSPLCTQLPQGDSLSPLPILGGNNLTGLSLYSHYTDTIVGPWVPGYFIEIERELPASLTTSSACLVLHHNTTLSDWVGQYFKVLPSYLQGF